MNNISIINKKIIGQNIQQKSNAKKRENKQKQEKNRDMYIAKQNNEYLIKIKIII